MIRITVAAAKYSHAREALIAGGTADPQTTHTQMWAQFDLMAVTPARSLVDLHAKAQAARTALNDDCGDQAERMLASIEKDLVALAGRAS